MPYRIDTPSVSGDALDRLLELGALDVEPSPAGGIAALLPDSVAPEEVTAALGGVPVSCSAAVARDAGSVWVLTPRPIAVGTLRIVPARFDADGEALRLTDSAAFGTGLHPTTTLCLEALQDILPHAHPEAMLDVGTGSGVLALAALTLGVPRAVGIDIDDEALDAAAENARLNALDRRLELIRGGPDAVTGTWPLVVANVLAAPLIELAPTLVRRLGRGGELLLSGIPVSVEPDVREAYRRLGMRNRAATSRAGWVALVLQASW